MFNMPIINKVFHTTFPFLNRRTGTSGLCDLFLRTELPQNIQKTDMDYIKVIALLVLSLFLISFN